MRVPCVGFLWDHEILSFSNGLQLVLFLLEWSVGSDMVLSSVFGWPSVSRVS